MKTILVVEDDPSLARLAQINLQAEGYQVVVDLDGNQACEYLSKNTPDLILLDLMLPTISGWELLRLIRAEERLHKTPVVVISAMARKEDQQRALQEGAWKFFVKPFSIQALLEYVAQLLTEEYET